MGDLVPKSPPPSARRSLEVVHTYLRKGEGVTRSVWVKVRPKNPVARLISAPLLFLTFGMMFLLMLLILGFTLMALALFWALAKRQRLESDQEQF